MIIAFSFLSLLNDDYKSAIVKFNQLDESNWLHYDVMDGNFVTNQTFDHKLTKEIKSYNNLFNDVHLMITNPIDKIADYASIGVDQITIHYEAVNSKELMEIIREIKKYNIKVGVSIKPNTDVYVLEQYLSYLDYILIMSVEPGKGGQKFMDDSLDKIRYLKSKQSLYHYLIGVDGGINNETSKLVKEAGADVVVIGSYLANNLAKETIDECK